MTAPQPATPGSDSAMTELAVACPLCHAEPGEFCVNMNTLEEVAGAVHPARERAQTERRRQESRTAGSGACGQHPGRENHCTSGVCGVCGACWHCKAREVLLPEVWAAERHRFEEER